MKVVVPLAGCSLRATILLVTHTIVRALVVVAVGLCPVGIVVVEVSRLVGGVFLNRRFGKVKAVELMEVGNARDAARGLAGSRAQRWLRLRRVGSHLNDGMGCFGSTDSEFTK
jgi:hypothetical protein